jgi:hypothetical protein
MVDDGVDIFVVVDGVRIARRGRPGTPQARTLEPGWQVLNGEGLKSIAITYDGVSVH